MKSNVTFIGGERLYKIFVKIISSDAKFISTNELLNTDKVLDLRSMNVVLASSPELAKIRYPITTKNDLCNSLNKLILSNVVFISSVGLDSSESHVDFLKSYRKEKIDVENYLVGKYLQKEISNVNIFNVPGLFSIEKKFRGKNFLDRIFDSIDSKSKIDFEIFNKGEQVRSFCETKYLLRKIADIFSDRKEGGFERQYVSNTNAIKIREIVSYLKKTKPKQFDFTFSDKKVGGNGNYGQNDGFANNLDVLDILEAYIKSDQI